MIAGPSLARLDEAVDIPRIEPNARRPTCLLSCPRRPAARAGRGRGHLAVARGARVSGAVASQPQVTPIQQRQRMAAASKAGHPPAQGSQHAWPTRAAPVPGAARVGCVHCRVGAASCVDLPISSCVVARARAGLVPKPCVPCPRVPALLMCCMLEPHATFASVGCHLASRQVAGRACSRLHCAAPLQRVRWRLRAAGAVYGVPAAAQRPQHVPQSAGRKGGLGLA